MDELGPVVTGALDGGNIELVGSGMVGTQHEFHLKIRPDPFTKHTDLTAHCQWFYFKVANVIGMPCHFSIMDLLKSSYPGAWPGYKIAYSYDMNDWFRVHNTDYDVTLGVLSWTVTPVHDQIFFAYFAPYSYARHLELIAQCSSSTLSTVKVIGHTLDHRFLELVVCGTGPVPIWINARQHPGETMAEWFMEGLIERLLDPVDPVSIQLRSLATLYCVPNMNPDGSVRGHLRTNAGGANLNREWASNGNYVAPSLERSPEVYYVLKAMDAVGCRMFVDVHGDVSIREFDIVLIKINRQLVGRNPCKFCCRNSRDPKLEF